MRDGKFNVDGEYVPRIYFAQPGKHVEVNIFLLTLDGLIRSDIRKMDEREFKVLLSVGSSSSCQFYYGVKASRIVYGMHDALQKLK